MKNAVHTVGRKWTGHPELMDGPSALDRQNVTDTLLTLLVDLQV